MNIDPSKLAELARYLYPELADQNPAAAVCEAATLIAEATNLLSPGKPARFPATYKDNGGTHAAVAEPLPGGGVMLTVEKKSSPEGLLKRLQDYKRKSGLSTTKMADRIGVHHASLSTWLKGKYLPSNKYLPKLEKFLSEQT